MMFVEVTTVVTTVVVTEPPGRDVDMNHQVLGSSWRNENMLDRGGEELRRMFNFGSHPQLTRNTMCIRARLLPDKKTRV